MNKEQLKHMQDILQAIENGETIEQRRISSSIDYAFDVWEKWDGKVLNFQDYQYCIEPKPPIVVRKYLECYTIDDKFKVWTPDTKEPNCEIYFDSRTGKLLKVVVL
jgi:hypothetical protein